MRLPPSNESDGLPNNVRAFPAHHRGSAAQPPPPPTSAPSRPTYVLTSMEMLKAQEKVLQEMALAIEELAVWRKQAELQIARLQTRLARALVAASDAAHPATKPR